MIRELLKTLIKEELVVINFEAKVISVDKDKDTCVVQAEDAPEIEGVKLRSIIGNIATKLIVYPVVNSYVTVSCLHNMPNELYVSQVSEVDEIITNCEQVTYNGGENGGLVNWPDLKTQLDKTNEVVDAIKEAMTNWVVVPNDGGGALKTLFNAAIAGKTTGNYEDLEDTKFLH